MPPEQSQFPTQSIIMHYVCFTSKTENNYIRYSYATRHFSSVRFRCNLYHVVYHNLQNSQLLLCLLHIAPPVSAVAWQYSYECWNLCRHVCHAKYVGQILSRFPAWFWMPLVAPTVLQSELLRRPSALSPTRLQHSCHTVNTTNTTFLAINMVALKFFVNLHGEN